jgi:arabinofuranosyltransferase
MSMLQAVTGSAAGLARRRPAAMLAVSCAALAALAWGNRFVQDDAFIAFRYAANLAAGHGLTWNPGERVEGYTNFLWTLVISVPLRLGLDPVRVSQALGIALFVGSLVATYRLALTVLGSPARALLAVWLLGTHYTFSAYATGGLETQLQAFLIIAAYATGWSVLVHDRWGMRRLGAISLLAAAALMTRLDSAIPLAVLFLLLLARLARRPRVAQVGPRPPVAAALAGLVLPVVIVIGAWLFWKLRYYGDILPNTFYAKTGAMVSMRQGIKYLETYASTYWLFPYAFGLAIGLPALLRRPRGLAWILVAVALWMPYVIAMGGDFMEFRLMVPILPLFAILAAWMVMTLRPLAARVALVALTVVGSAHHALRFQPTPEIDSVAELARYVEEPASGWITAGKALASQFGGAAPPVTIATTAAGAIPFYSGLPTIDMHGLTDPWIARHGFVRGSARPGHRRIATLAYLEQRGVQLVIGHPRIEPLGPGMRHYSLADRVVVADAAVPPDPRILIIPLNRRFGLHALYLVHHPAVDRAIEQLRLESYPAARL